MFKFVWLLGISLCSCLSVKAQANRDVWAYNVRIDEPWNQTIDFPESDSFCAINIHVTAKWGGAKGTTAPETDGEYSVEFTFEHPNFKENETKVMKIPKDQKQTEEDIHICFSSCPTPRTQMDPKETFSLFAKTDNIQPKNAIDVQVTVQKSYLDYSENCSDKTIGVQTPATRTPEKLVVYKTSWDDLKIVLLVFSACSSLYFGYKFICRIKKWLKPEPEGLPGPGGTAGRSVDQDLGGGPSNAPTNETSATPQVPLPAGCRSGERNNRNAGDKRGIKKKPKDE